MGDFNLSLVVPLEAGEHDLPLSWFQSVHHARNRSFVVHVGEEDQLFVDELGVGDGACGLSVEEGLVQPFLLPLSTLLQPTGEPLLASVNTLLTESLQSQARTILTTSSLLHKVSP